METWSATIVENFRIRLAFDTNILSYLIDDSYPSLTKFVKLFVDSPFSEQVVGSFVTYEFVGIRKREHFLRKVFQVANSNLNLSNGTGFSYEKSINLSSLLKYKDSYNTPDLNYLDVADIIIRLIDDEIKRLKIDFNVDLNDADFHDRLFIPTKELYLNSRISKEDCLVLVSTMLPKSVIPTRFVCLLTNDNGYENSFSENTYRERVDQVFSLNTLVKPQIEGIKKILGKNLTELVSDEDLGTLYKEFILNMLCLQNNQYFLGKTFNDSCSNVKNVLCFTLESEVAIPDKPYLTLISRDLDFIINSSESVTYFVNKDRVVITNFPIEIGQHPDNKFSFIFPVDSDHPEKTFIDSAIKKGGHYLFINPIQ